MSQLVALSVSIGVLGAVWAFLALGPLAGFVLVWAGFIAWGCFFHTGGDNKALIKTIAGNAYGALVAWIAFLIIVNVPVAAAGKMATGPLQNLAAGSFANPLVLLIASMVIGALFGYVSGQLAKMLTKGPAAARA